MRIWIGRFVLSASLLLACNGSDEIAAEDTSSAFRYIAGLAYAAAYEVQTEYADATDPSVSVNIAFDCDRGSVKISGTTSTCAETARHGTYSLTVTATNCSSDGVLLDGTIEHSATADETGRLIYTIEGEVLLAGEVEGSCAIDVAYEFPPGSGYTISGSLCGHDRESLELMTGLLLPRMCPGADASGS